MTLGHSWSLHNEPDESIKQVMDAVNKSSPQSGAPCQVNYNNVKFLEYIHIYKLFL